MLFIQNFQDPISLESHSSPNYALVLETERDAKYSEVKPTSFMRKVDFLQIFAYKKDAFLSWSLYFHQTNQNFYKHQSSLPTEKMAVIP